MIRGLLATIVVGTVAAFGWHWSHLDEAREAVEKIPSIRLVSRGIPVEVSIHPVTNRVRLRLEIAFAADPEDLLSKLGKELAGVVVEEAWPSAVEARLAELAREQRDVWALVFPYRAEVVPP